jgi:O-antigen/teichoic acid export membrane protein
MAASILTRARPLLLARLAAAVLGIAVPMVLARVLLPASYGTFKQGFLVSQTLALMLPMALTQSLYYFVPREPASRDRLVAQTVWIHVALGALAAAILLGGRPLVAHQFGNEELTRNLGWVAAFTALQIAGAPLDLAWNASGRIGRPRSPASRPTADGASASSPERRSRARSRAPSPG